MMSSLLLPCWSQRKIFTKIGTAQKTKVLYNTHEINVGFIRQEKLKAGKKEDIKKSFVYFILEKVRNYESVFNFLQKDAVPKEKNEMMRLADLIICCRKK